MKLSIAFSHMVNYRIRQRDHALPYSTPGSQVDFVVVVFYPSIHFLFVNVEGVEKESPDPRSPSSELLVFLWS